MGRGLTRRAAVVSLLLAALIVAGGARLARADGDPASDYLVGNQVFVTSESVPVSPAERQLIALVKAANQHGFGIRVALVSTDYDLGSITELWLKPTIYARFLGLEISPVYKQRLLVVMPNGFGFNWPGHATTAAYRVLAGVGVRGDAVAAAAETAVRRLAAADGITLEATQSTPGGGVSTGLVVALLVLAVAALAAIAALIVLPRARRRWRGRSRRERAAPDVSPAQPSASGGGAPVRLRWLIPGVAVLCAVAVTVVVLVVRRGATSVSDASIITAPPFSWPAGRRPAPRFALRDQNGRPVSLAAYRGRPVIVTFIDPLCRNLCPLEAQVLNQTVRELPASQKPAILAVSVDVYADTRADMLQDFSEWRLVPQWRWAVGSPGQLAAVWKRYEIGVSVDTQKIDGTTINYITHTEAAYIIDATGHERALFLWPFYPQDVKRVLSKLD
jgi:protein SCO1